MLLPSPPKVGRDSGEIAFPSTLGSPLDVLSSLPKRLPNQQGGESVLPVQKNWSEGK